MVIRIDYESQAFPKAYSIGSGSLETSWNELLWAAITIGRPNVYHVFQHGHTSLYEAIFRTSLMKMSVQKSTTGHLERTQALKSLDPTEKGMVSYFLGMVICKLFATNLLKTHWLLHLDVFRSALNPVLLGRSRPDLVGEDTQGQWHAFECKGRSSEPSQTDKEKAKSQASRLHSVNGKHCKLQIGSFAFFKSEELQFYWCDPQPINPEPIDLPTPDRVWRHYYQPALALAGDDKSMRDGAGSSMLDISVSIHPEILILLREGLWLKAREQAKRMRDHLEDEGFQPDGIKVVAGSSW